MITQIPKSRPSFYSFLTTPALPIFLWLILVTLLFLKITINLSYVLFGISTILIFSHVLYGGYFLFKKENRINTFVFFITLLIYICLIFLVQTIAYPFLWFFWLQIMFLCAAVFHRYYKSKLIHVYLQEFCNYKLCIEIGGIILCFLGMVCYLIFPSYTVILGALTLIFIIRFNIFIFKKKKLYNIYYQPPDILKMPFISIVIIAYNEEQYIGELLESIKTQDWPKYEVILVDDHSTDRTVEIARGFKSYFSLKIAQKDIRGPSRSRNYGATFAKGEIILFLDADVVIPSTFITNNIKVFIEQRLSIAGVDFMTVTKNKIDKLITSFYRIWLKTVQYFNPRGIGFCLFVYKELHKKVLFDESVLMSEDFDYVRRASHYGKFRIIDTAPLEVSWRRFHQENRILLILKYMFFEWYRQNIGEIRKKILPYEFGSSDLLQK